MVFFAAIFSRFPYSLHPRNGARGGAVGVLEFEGEAREHKQFVAALVEVAEIFDVDHFLLREERVVAFEVVVMHGIKADDVEADALVIALKDEG